jgi:hypothetical protein
MATNTIKVIPCKGQNKVSGEVISQSLENIVYDGELGLCRTTVLELYGGQRIELWEYESPKKHVMNIRILE